METTENYLGYVLSLFSIRGGEEIFIPFVCRRCGKCCREISVYPGYFKSFKIADYLKISVTEVVENYLTKPRKPCVFFENNKCKIYPVRPEPCKSFPILTDFSDKGIGCPGLLSCSRASKRLRKNIRYNQRPYEGKEKPIVHMRLDRWNKNQLKYLSSKPSKEALYIFISVNSTFIN